MKAHQILLLENDNLERQKMEGVLSKYGFKVNASKDGFAGLQILYRQTPDLIISNIDLPVVDGFDILKTVKSNRRLKDVPFMFVATELDEQKILASKKLGANAFVKMPSSNTLLYAIKKCLRLEMLVAE